MDLASVGIGNGGWVRLRLAGRTEKPFVLARLADLDGDLRVRELYLEGPVTDRVLKFLSVREIEDLFNFGDPAMGSMVRRKLDVLAPDVRGAASWWDATGAGLPSDVPRPHSSRRPVSARLDVPAARPFGDAFYRKVADVRERLDRAGVPAASAIAEANGVNVTQVYRWFKIAKSRGF